MAWRVHDYKCENDQCEKHDQTEERMVQADEVDDQRCEICGITLKRCVSATRTTHISWSTWRV